MCTKERLNKVTEFRGYSLSASDGALSWSPRQGTLGIQPVVPFVRLAVRTMIAAIGRKGCHFRDYRKCWGQEMVSRSLRDQL